MQCVYTYTHSNMCKKLWMLKKKSMQNALILEKKKNHLCCHSFSKIQLNFVVLFHVLFKNIVYLSL